MKKEAKSNREKLHSKLRGVYHAVSRGGRGRVIACWSAKRLAYELLDLIMIAVKNEQLPLDYRLYFEQSSRSEILCSILKEAKESLRRNKEKYGVKYNRHWSSDEEIALEQNVFRLTKEELIDKYDISDVYESFESSFRKGRVFVTDVLYGQFLRDNSLHHRKGAEITAKDLPPITGNDVMARYDLLQRAAHGLLY